MRAAIYTGPGVPLEIGVVSDPIPSRHGVVIAVGRSGVCGSDVTLSGSFPHSERFEKSLRRPFVPGAILGHEYGGEIVAVGAEVKGLRLGQRVAPMFFSGCGDCRECNSGATMRCRSAVPQMGGYAEYAAVAANSCVVVPRTVTDSDAAAVEPLATSHHAWTLGRAPSGARLLVIGAGSLGLGIATMARALGVGPVAVVARSLRRRDDALAAGASSFHVANEGLATEVRQALGGRPHVVFEASGSSNAVQVAVDCVASGGTVVVAGLALSPGCVWHADAVMKELRIQYSNAYSFRDFEAVTRMMAEGRIDVPQTGRTVGFEEFSTEFEGLRSPSTGPKLYLNPSAS